jgi:hypothetical protein
VAELAPPPTRVAGGDVDDVGVSGVRGCGCGCQVARALAVANQQELLQRRHA